MSVGFDNLKIFWAISVFACLSSVDQSHAACVCIIRMHAHQLILLLSIAGFGQYLSSFHWLILGPSREYYSPRKDTLRA
jgi:hypothetical protein